MPVLYGGKMRTGGKCFAFGVKLGSFVAHRTWLTPLVQDLNHELREFFVIRNFGCFELGKFYSLWLT